jgi:hypothetical protein
MLNLVFLVPEISVECEDCGYELRVPRKGFVDPDFVICSTCNAARKLEYRLKRLRETHSRKFDAKVPPMIHIDTKDLPGFVKDSLAQKIGETLDLFDK